MKYSGKTTCYEHKRGDWTKTLNSGPECIQQQTVFEVQWSNCPVEVVEEVKRLWQDYELGNDYCYFAWNSEEDNENPCSYPIIDEFLKSKSITNCLIHYWW